MRRKCLSTLATRAKRSRRRRHSPFLRVENLLPEPRLKSGLPSKAFRQQLSTWRRKRLCFGTSHALAKVRLGRVQILSSGGISQQLMVVSECLTIWRWDASQHGRSLSGQQRHQFLPWWHTVCSGETSTVCMQSNTIAASHGCKVLPGCSAGGVRIQKLQTHGRWAAPASPTSMLASGSSGKQVGLPTRGGRHLPTFLCTTWVLIGGLVLSMMRRCF
mmetsp:Transcript_47676/g.83947  ORF Transcript_47676/g.83947 Transcript_47676/m.83947 type:complete len:217 (-) Transcript_47676:445-1095(-)